MLKSIKATTAIIFLILIYGLSGMFILQKNINSIYWYIINPLFWIILSIILYVLLGRTIQNKKIKKTITQYTLVAVLVYIIVYMLSGIFVTFGKNPYLTTIKGLIINFWLYGTIIIAKEYIRFKLINNVLEKDKVKIAVLISIVYVIIGIQVNKFLGENLNLFAVFKYIFQVIIPIIVKNILFSYIAINKNFIQSIIYELGTNLYFWISPILPNSIWLMTTIIDTTIPIVLGLYIRYSQTKYDRFRTKEDILYSNPANVIPLISVVVISIFFAIGIFPIKPVAIASGSMEKELNVGDIVIIKKCNANDVNVGDIIEYQMNGYTVIHRITKKEQVKGEFIFKTKGDNNKQEDRKKVLESQLIGKVIFKIKYLGYPAIWMKMMNTNENNLEVDIAR